MVNVRPTWDLYMLRIADAVAARADCTRRQVGAVIMDLDHRIVATGYNGAITGMPGCLTDNACPRGQHYRTGERGEVAEFFAKCACGNAWPCASYAEPGSSYDTGVGACTAIHAEQNAILYAHRSLVGCVIYVTARPCDGCLRLIRAAKLADAVYPHNGQVWTYDCETLVEYVLR